MLIERDVYFEFFYLGVTYHVVVQPIVLNKGNELHALKLLPKGKGVCKPELFFSDMQQQELVLFYWGLIDAFIEKNEESAIRKVCISICDDVLNNIFFISKIISIKSRLNLILDVNLSETTGDGSYNLMRGSFKAIQKFGHEVWLSDYSPSLHYDKAILNLPWNGVKIDKSMLWNPDLKPLENSISLLNKLRLPTRLDGVESKDMQKISVALGIDYSQGFDFS